MKNVVRKLIAKVEQGADKRKLREVHDIIKLMEVKHFKTDMALTELKILCTRQKK